MQTHAQSACTFTHSICESQHEHAKYSRMSLRLFTLICASRSRTRHKSARADEQRIIHRFAPLPGLVDLDPWARVGRCLYRCRRSAAVVALHPTHHWRLSWCTLSVQYIWTAYLCLRAQQHIKNTQRRSTAALFHPGIVVFSTQSNVTFVALFAQLIISEA